jgi:hypothetical protein
MFSTFMLTFLPAGNCPTTVDPQLKSTQLNATPLDSTRTSNARARVKSQSFFTTGGLPPISSAKPLEVHDQQLFSTEPLWT